MLPVCRTPDDVYAIPPFEVTCEDVEGFLDELHEFHALFRDCFVRREPREHFFRYMVGQFSTLERKSIEPIAVQTDASSVRATPTESFPFLTKPDSSNINTPSGSPISSAMRPWD